MISQLLHYNKVTDKVKLTDFENILCVKFSLYNFYADISRILNGVLELDSFVTIKLKIDKNEQTMGLEMVGLVYPKSGKQHRLDSTHVSFLNKHGNTFIKFDSMESCFIAKTILADNPLFDDLVLINCFK